MSAVRLGPVTITMALERSAIAGSVANNSRRPERIRDAGNTTALTGEVLAEFHSCEQSREVAAATSRLCCRLVG
jgi:hypothetical protein